MDDKELVIRKNRELAAILEVSTVMTSSFDLEGNLSSAMQTLSTQLDMQRGCVFLLEGTSGQMRIAAAHGLSPEEINRGTYRIGEGIVGRVIESGSPLFIPDIGSEPKFLNRTGARPTKDGISFICIPIRLKDQTMGVLSVDRIYTEEHGGVDDDLRVLNIVASLIAQFVRLWQQYRSGEQERLSLKSQLKERFSLPNLVGQSERFRAVIKSVEKVADTEATVLLLGESGTGKELIARTLHYQSRRSQGAFVAVNCAALPENLMEAELFGAEKGAFTGAVARRAGRFEMAAGGSIFLDEIGELPLSVQAKLLRVLQERSFERVGSSQPVKADVRVIAATNRDLMTETRAGRFREDLYWRLNVVPLLLPPLRERQGDIPQLVFHYLEKFNAAYKKRVCLDEGTMAALEAYPWPGNIRELANVMERMVILSARDAIRAEDLPFGIRGGTPACAMDAREKGADLSMGPSTLTSEVEVLERERIMRALKDNDMIQQRASKALGITPRQLGYRIKKYGIEI